MQDQIPHLTPSEHRVRYDDDDHTHIALTVFFIWCLAVAYVANWLAGG